MPHTCYPKLSKPISQSIAFSRPVHPVLRSPFPGPVFWHLFVKNLGKKDPQFSSSNSLFNHQRLVSCSNTLRRSHFATTHLSPAPALDPCSRQHQVVCHARVHQTLTIVLERSSQASPRETLRRRRPHGDPQATTHLRQLLS